jgi:hypothetical protein
LSVKEALGLGAVLALLAFGAGADLARRQSVLRVLAVTLVLRT